MPKDRPKWHIVAEWLFNELIIFCDNANVLLKNFDSEWIRDIEYMRYYYDNSITQHQYNKAKDYVENLVYNAEYYFADNQEMLQLHDNHTLWKLSIPETSNKSEEEINCEYVCAVNGALEKFNKKAKCDGEIGCYGRSGRHVCIPLTLHNISNFTKYKELAESLEQEVIDCFNKETEEAAYMEYTIKIYPKMGNSYKVIVDVPEGVLVNTFIDNWLDENITNVDYWNFA